MSSSALSLTSSKRETRKVSADTGVIASLLPSSLPVVDHWRMLMLTAPQDTLTKKVIAHTQTILQISQNPDIHRLLLDLVFFEETLTLAVKPDGHYLFPAIRFVLGSPDLRHTLGAIKPYQLLAAADQSLIYASLEQESLARTVGLLSELESNPWASIQSIDNKSVGTLISAMLGCELARSPQGDPLLALPSYPLGSGILTFLNRGDLKARDLLFLDGVYCPRSLIKYIMRVDHA